jgi:hypothetical protein
MNAALVVRMRANDQAPHPGIPGMALYNAAFAFRSVGYSIRVRPRVNFARGDGGHAQHDYCHCRSVDVRALAYGGVLQDRARRKTYEPGASIFSVSAMFRSLGTKEMFYFFLLTLAMIAFAGTIIALDEAGYLSR